MTIHKLDRKTDYVKMANEVAQDESLSFEARGVLCYFLSRSPDWQPSIKDVARQGGMGRNRARKIMAELEAAGFVKKSQGRDRGRYGSSEVIISALPEAGSESPALELVHDSGIARGAIQQSKSDPIPADGEPAHGAGITRGDPIPVDGVRVNGVWVHGVEPPKVKEVKEKEVTQERDTKTLVPYQEIVDVYHENCPSLSRVKKLTPARKSAIRRLWVSDIPTIDAWREFFATVEASDFLAGRAGTWSAGIDWLLKPANTIKVAEGNYTNREVQSHGKLGDFNERLTDTSW